MSIPINQVRGSFAIEAFHIFAGYQLTPGVPMILSHKHPQPHLMIFLNPPLVECPHCKGALPVPEYVVKRDDEIVDKLGPYNMAHVAKGVSHSVEQIVPGALGGFACIFPKYDKDGLVSNPQEEKSD